MNKILIKLFILTLVFFTVDTASSKPVVKMGKDIPYNFAQRNGNGDNPDAVVIQRVKLQANNIAAYFQNTGIFNQNTISGNTAGFEWPKGQNPAKTACFTAGLSIGCYIDGQLAQVMASYKGEYAPGIIQNLTGFTSPDFKIYNVKSGDNAGNNPDYANWYKMVPYGAPYDDVNQNGVFDPLIDKPGRKNAAQTFFLAMTDGFAAERNSGEGFGGGITSPLLGCDVRLTAWAYTSPGLEDLQFVNFVVINRGDKTWNRTYLGIVVDPDLGNANDDYIGCDTTLNLGYCYNGAASDNVYGSAPPAFGMDYFKSPIIKTAGQPNDTIGLTSFAFFTNTGSAPPPCESDPNGEPLPAYYMLSGVKKDSSLFLDPTTNPPTPTKFVYPGDPETNTGWTENKGSIQNCNRLLSGTTVATNPTGDRRFIFNSGRENFTFNPGDTQNIVLAQFVAQGTNNKNSVTKLKNLDKTAQIIYDNDFNVTPPPPQPVVTTSVDPLNTTGQAKITLSWGNESESYSYWDTIFYTRNDSNIYKFQGYEIYEIDKSVTSLPDFAKPESIDNSVRLIAIYDLRDSIGTVIDTFATGAAVNGVDQYAPFPILPPYRLSPNAEFPNSGIYRSISIIRTNFPSNYANNSNIIYGQEYRFAVLAYGYSGSKKIRKGFKLIRNSLSSSVMKVTPVAPPLGSQFTYKNGDTINTSQRDLPLIPIIRNQNLLQNATYKIVFNADTSYNIQRKLSSQSVYDTLFRNIRYMNYKSAADDSARTIDGVVIKVNKIRYTYSAGGNSLQGNGGVIKDNNATLTPDSIQTRQSGWDYLPAGNNPYTGSKYRTDVAAWQSVSMSISFPTNSTYLNLGTSYKLDSLKKVRIVFDANNKQKAYRYLADSVAPNYVYQDYVDVPFKVYEIDETDRSAAPRQLNCAFVEFPVNAGGRPDGQWNPGADSLGSREVLYIFGSDYNATASTFYTAKNLYINQAQFDIMYLWSPKLRTANSTFTNGDQFTIYPYTVVRPLRDAGIPLSFTFETQAPTFGSSVDAAGKMDNIRVVPNPYYGVSSLDRSPLERFVAFRNLPLECTIKIFTLNGDLINTIRKTAGSNTSTSSTAEWNLRNFENVPIASGIYVAFIDAPGVGQKFIKIAVFTEQERTVF